MSFREERAFLTQVEVLIAGSAWLGSKWGTDCCFHKKEFDPLIPVLLGTGLEPLIDPAALPQVGLPQTLKVARMGS